jgi:hypothetical protein
MSNLTRLFCAPRICSFEYLDDGAAPMQVLSLTTDASDDRVDLLVSEYQSNLSVIHQLSYSFDNYAYAFVFGDRPTTYEISAVVFPDVFVCPAATKKRTKPGKPESAKDKDPIYLDFVHAFFEDHKLKTGNVNPSPVYATVGAMYAGSGTNAKTIKGYIVSYEISAAPEDSMRADVKFTMLGFLNSRDQYDAKD